jgi:hypothetical protein
MHTRVASMEVLPINTAEVFCICIGFMRWLVVRRRLSSGNALASISIGRSDCP